MAENNVYTASMNRLIEQFAALPGIGRRTAERLAFHMLKSSSEEALKLAHAIEDVKQHVRHCSVCYNLTEADPCSICSDPRRDQRKILVVEQPKDVIMLEQTATYDGVYHVLLGHLAALEGVTPTDLTIDPLVERIEKLAGESDAPVEVILGTNPNMEGDGTALYVADRLEDVAGANVSRLARGLPTGSQIEYANKAVLADAIQSRQRMS